MSRHNIDHDHEHGMILLKALRPHKGYKYQGNYTEKWGRGKDMDEGTWGGSYRIRSQKGS